MSLSYLTTLFFILFFFFFFAIVDARIKLPSNVTVPAVIGFGDSNIDPGNNNNIETLAKCNFPPYGKDFMGVRPTGRFSNGKIPTDILVEELGIKEYLPAYLDPELSPEELLTRVSFASGAAGYDPLTSSLVTVIPLSQQLEMFKEYKGKVTTLVGPERASFIISNSLYVVVAGSCDIANTYFGTSVRRAQYDFNGYTDLMLTHASSFLQELYGLGARRIGVLSAPPIGCVPSQRTVGSFPIRTCATDYNKVAQMFNSKISSHIKSLKPSFPNSRLVYIDIYTPLLDIITDDAQNSRSRKWVQKGPHKQTRDPRHARLFKNKTRNRCEVSRTSRNEVSTSLPTLLTRPPARTNHKRPHSRTNHQQPHSQANRR